MKQTVDVMGVAITLEASAHNPNYVTEVANHVNEVAKKIESEIQACPLDKLAIMTALEITDEFFRAAACASTGKRAEARIESLVARIESALSTGQ